MKRLVQGISDTAPTGSKEGVIISDTRGVRIWIEPAPGQTFAECAPILNIYLRRPGSSDWALDAGRREQIDTDTIMDRRSVVVEYDLLPGALEMFPHVSMAEVGGTATDAALQNKLIIYLEAVPAVG